MADSKPDRDAAYALKTPEDSVALYREWAKTYDQDFAKANDYRNPQLIAEQFAKRCDVDMPVLDVGAGTGLVGEALTAHGLAPIDALDISHEMLVVADSKGCYRNIIQGDLTGQVDIPDSSYGGVISVGTFTHGHVGSEAIDELLRLARSGALFALGINAEVYKANGFAAKFASLKGRIDGFEIFETCGYGKQAEARLQQTRSSVALFRKR
ncbi:class I SAM-dependent DNA methyltransferase [Profundibacter amoris]|uniref:Class I SAM-dependent methyltransferase n=1 Tax=Profundibacter amoris TaxID=2171755 RepID=A0A347UJ02_9RHOB|nr:methyltransferase domain-containing protein [Profundibacter amoris]AXX98830.1 class I SAM-dependent methyltransferase [Profundibacter amoris]